MAQIAMALAHRRALVLGGFGFQMFGQSRTITGGSETEETFIELWHKPQL